MSSVTSWMCEPLKAWYSTLDEAEAGVATAEAMTGVDQAATPSRFLRSIVPERGPSAFISVIC